MVPTTERSRQVRLHLTVLGTFRATRNGEAFAQLHQGRLRALITFLLLHRQEPVPRQHAAFALWPETSDKQARTNLRTLLVRLRQALGESSHLLHATRQTLQIRRDAALSADLSDFDQALERAAAATADDDKARSLIQAVTLYGGDLLPDCYDEWIVQARESYRTRYLAALEELIQIHERARRYDRAIEYAEAFLRTDPLHEALYRQLMRLHALNDDRGSALRTYHRCVKILRRELDVEPATKTSEAYEALVRHEPVITGTTEAVAVRSPMVGREREWVQLVDGWRRVGAGNPALVIISGEAGIGKSRLAEELAAWASRQGSEVAVAQSYALGRGFAFDPVVEWLRTDTLRTQWLSLDAVWLTELTRLMPELRTVRPDVPAPAPLGDDWQRHHQFEALARAVLVGDRPRLLIIDDLQWSGREMLDWLHYLLQFAGQFPLLVVTTVRTDEVAEDSAYAAFCLTLQRGGFLTELPLQPLSAAETAQLAAALRGSPLDAPSSAALHRETEGNPLFVVEMVRTRQSGDTGFAEEAALEHSLPPTAYARRLPPKIASVLRYRLAQLSPAARDIVQCAAVIGRQFHFADLLEACEQPEDIVVAAVDELWERQIIREQGIHAYDFSHDKLRAVAYAEISPAQRRRYHRRVAAALAERHEQDLDRVIGQIAAHYKLAGLKRAAIDSYERAAEGAARLYAHDDALFYFQQGLALLETSSAENGPADRKTAARLLERIGDIYAIVGRHEEARATYRTILTRTPAPPCRRRGDLLRKIGDSLYTQHQHDLALANYRAAEARLEDGAENPEPARRKAWIELQLSLLGLYYGTAANEELSNLIQALRPVVEAHGTPVQRAKFLEGVALDGMRRDRYTTSDATLADQRAALAAWRETKDQGGTANSQFSVGFCLLWRRELAGAEAALQAALTQATTIGHARVRLLCVTYLAVLERFRGDLAQTAHYAERTLALAEQTGIQFYIGMAKANLAWVATRHQHPAEAAWLCREALALMPPAYPFRWAALWPQFGLALSRNDRPGALECARQLLDPGQQRLPAELTRLLSVFLSETQPSSTALGESLHRVEALATRMGYL